MEQDIAQLTNKLHAIASKLPEPLEDIDGKLNLQLYCMPIYNAKLKCLEISALLAIANRLDMLYLIAKK